MSIVEALEKSGAFFGCIGLSRLIKDKTVLIIAHRMRTIANADHIVVLKDGVVAEQGSPAQLTAYDSIYSRMTKQQMISQNWKM